MPITEFAILHLLPSYSFHCGIPADLFRTLSIWQSESSTHPLYFFADKTNESTIYLISGWHGVDAHLQWIASDRNQELLQTAEPFLEVKGMVHLDIDFTEMPSNCEVVIVTRYKDGLKGGSRSVEHEKSTWVGAGKDLELGSETTYQISGWCEKNGFGALGDKDDVDVMTMTRLHIPS